jgi:cation diffusion facilitator family transporter
MYADGFHSLLDAGASAIGVIGVVMSARPPDPSHPYGYERYENLTSLVIGGFLMLAIFEILSGAVNRFTAPRLPVVTWLSYSIVGISMLASAGVAWWERSRALKLTSDLIKADALHTFSDVLVSGVVMFSLLGGVLGIRILDPVVAVAIAVVLGWAAFKVVRQATRILTDASIIDIKEIIRVAGQVPGVADCHAVRARGPTGQVRADLHVLVDGNMSVFQAHEITEAVTKVIQELVPGIVEVLVHTGPVQKHAHELNNKDVQ